MSFKKKKSPWVFLLLQAQEEGKEVLAGRRGPPPLRAPRAALFSADPLDSRLALNEDGLPKGPPVL